MGTDISGIARTVLQARANGNIKVAAEESEKDMTVDFMNLLNQSSLKSSIAEPIGCSDDDMVADAESVTKTAYDAYSKPMKNVSVKEKVTSEDLYSEMESSVKEYEEEIRGVLKNELGVTDEEISAAMDSLGMNFLDLRNLQNLATLMQVMTGENVGTLFLSDTFQVIVDQVTVLTEELCAELGISQEELEVLCEDWKQMDLTVSADVETTENLVENTILQEADTKEEPGITTTDTTETDVSVTADALDGNVTEMNSADADNAGTNLRENVIVEGRIETEVTGEEMSDKVSEVPDNNIEDVEKISGTANSEQTETVVAQIEEEQSEKIVADSEEDDNGWSVKTESMEELANGTQEESGENFNEQTFSKQSQNAKTDSLNTNVSIATQQHAANQEKFVIQQEPIRSYANQIDTVDLIQQIARNVRVTISATTTSMEMQLNPQNLGKIYLNISERDGVIRAQIATQTETVRDALETQLVELRQSLNQQGIKVDAIEVSVATHEFEQNLEGNGKQEEQMHQQMEETKKQARKNLNLNEIDALSGLMTEEEQLVAQIMRDNGNQVDLTA